MNPKQATRGRYNEIYCGPIGDGILCIDIAVLCLYLYREGGRVYEGYMCKVETGASTL